MTAPAPRYAGFWIRVTAATLGHYLAYLIATLPSGLGLLWVAFDARKQGWHDELAGTLVLHVHDDTDLAA
jgi:uncharacterized RDD family membrane protein YckC